MMPANSNNDRHFSNPVLATIEDETDTWMIYEYLYVPCKSLKKHVYVNPDLDINRCYYQCLSKALFKMTQEERKGKMIPLVLHGNFYQVVLAQKED